ncbi:hypothetical protein ACQR1I_24115 [Bradyrhizobium sp. HKCCYLS2038]|uniref:hypothetical protein n=1 Tax=unclassified Bradyrhizobium TaxID=2631580 RepID=UPI003EBEC307
MILNKREVFFRGSPVLRHSSRSKQFGAFMHGAREAKPHSQLKDANDAAMTLGAQLRR